MNKNVKDSEADLDGYVPLSVRGREERGKCETTFGRMRGCRSRRS